MLMYKFLQVSRQSQSLTFRDPTIRKIAEKYLQAEMDAKRKKLRSAVEVQEATKEDPSFTRKHLVKTAKRQVTKEDDKRRLVELQSLPKQGHMHELFDDPYLSGHLG